MQFGVVRFNGGPRFALIDGQHAYLEERPEQLPAGIDAALRLSLAELRVAIEHADTARLQQVSLQEAPPLAPIGREQEVWASGVTYDRSRLARMAEAREKDIYDRVYEAERPELFFKAPAWRVVGPGDAVAIRADSAWNVPEPELTLVINSALEIVGYTIGNDMSSRSIEGDNPLYLPQAKIYERSCALGPAILPVWEAPQPETLQIGLAIHRGGAQVFAGEIGVDQVRRSFTSLVAYLGHSLSFPSGAYLLTGTGIVPPESFTLEAGDEVRITIEPIGTLINPVVRL